MARNAYLTLLAGVTTVRDMGAQNCLNIYLRDAVNARVVPGPRICACGSLVCMTGGHGWPFGLEADGEAEVRKAVREQLKAGADVVKLMATGGVMTLGVEPGALQFTYRELRAGAEEAHKAGRKAASHVQGAEGLHNALKAGIDTIEHGIFIDDEAIRMFLENGAFLVPTLCAPHYILKNGVEKGILPEIIRKTERVAAAHLDSAKKAYRAGVVIAMGTDAGTPFNMHGENLKELELLHGIGMAPMEAHPRRHVHRGPGARNGEGDRDPGSGKAGGPDRGRRRPASGYSHPSEQREDAGYYEGWSILQDGRQRRR